MLLLHTASVLAYNSSRCDTTLNEAFAYTIIPPYCYNITADEMESMINNKAQEKNLILTEGSEHVVLFFIDCYGNDFRHTRFRSEAKALDSILIEIIRDSTKWVPAHVPVYNGRYGQSQTPVLYQAGVQFKVLNNKIVYIDHKQLKKRRIFRKDEYLYYFEREK